MGQKEKGRRKFKVESVTCFDLPQHIAAVSSPISFLVYCAWIATLLDGHPCRMAALTGHGQEADKARSGQAGFERHLVKPVNPDLVVRLVSSCAVGQGAGPG